MKSLAVAIALILSLLTGCSSKPQVSDPPPGAGSPKEHRYSADDVVKALKGAGLEAASTGEEIGGEAFGTTGKIVTVGDETMQVYVYGSAADQQAVKISPDGFSVEYKGKASMISWLAKPHFARKGNLIVAFATRDEGLAMKVIAAVESMK